MRKYLTTAFLLLIVVGSSISVTKTNCKVISINADSLIEKIDNYNNTNVQIEGIIVHVCSVDGGKMKLKTDSGNIICIIPSFGSVRFDKSFYKQRVKVVGLVKETRRNNEYVDNMEKHKYLLCHIDNTPCKDSTWVNNKRKAGISDSLSLIDTARLRKKMKDGKKEYVSVVTIYAEQVEIINEK